MNTKLPVAFQRAQAEYQAKQKEIQATKQAAREEAERRRREQVQKQRQRQADRRIYTAKTSKGQPKLNAQIGRILQGLQQKAEQA